MENQEETSENFHVNPTEVPEESISEEIAMDSSVAENLPGSDLVELSEIPGGSDPIELAERRTDDIVRISGVVVGTDQIIPATLFECKVASWIAALTAFNIVSWFTPGFTIPLTYSQLRAERLSCWLFPLAASVFAGTTWSFLRRKPAVKINPDTTLSSIWWSGLNHGLKHALLWVPSATLLAACCNNISLMFLRMAKEELLKCPQTENMQQAVGMIDQFAASIRRG